MSHRSAAALANLRLPRPPRPEITVDANRAPMAPGVVVHRSVDLCDDDLAICAGIPITRPSRLLVDLGAVVAPHHVERALDELVGRKAVTLAQVRLVLERVAARGRSGCGVLRDILDRRAGHEHLQLSHLEAQLLRHTQAAGLPPMVLQHPVVVGGRRRRIDFAFPELRLAIEVDGYESHSRYDTFEDDRVRANELELAGWRVLHFTWRQVCDRPDYVIDVLRRAVALARAEAA